nr:hypothetical protein I308_04237 [Cryptococcus tetragattii IND107]
MLQTFWLNLLRQHLALLLTHHYRLPVESLLMGGYLIYHP